jgi:hypothetical protein
VPFSRSAAVLAACAALAAPACASDLGYADAEQAFDAVFIDSGLAERAYVENREYAAAIYQMPDGRWHATAAVAGDLTRSAIPYDAVPAQAMRVVGAHSHGRPDIPGDPSHRYGTDFSEADRHAAIHNYRATRGRIAVQLLLTSRLEILRMTLSQGYDPQSGQIAVLAQVTSVGSIGKPPLPRPPSRIPESAGLLPPESAAAAR